MKLFLLAVAVLLCAIEMGTRHFSTCPEPAAARLGSATAPSAPRGMNEPLVRGYIAVTVGGKRAHEAKGAPTEDIYVPNVKVVLRDEADNIASDAALTDLSGRFTVRALKPGRYRVCWSARGIEAGCDKALISVDRWYRNIGTVHIPLPRKDGHVALYGRVTLADGSTPRHLDALANTNAFATITLTDRLGKRLFRIPVNNQDQYFFPSVPLDRTLVVNIREERYKHDQLLRLSNGQIPAQRLDFTIQNSPPTIDPLVALDNNKQRVSNAVTDAVVTLNARVADPDKDHLGYLWQVSSGTLSSPTDPEPKWNVPRTPGNHAATVMVYDGKGGYATSSMKLTVDRSGLVFSGTVSGTDSPAIAGAEIDVNGKAAVTDSRGFFRVQVQDRKRFVMTIRKAGYAFSSNVYYDAVVGGRWKLTRAQVIRVDPTKPIDIQHEKRSSEECSGPPSERLDWKQFRTLAVPQYQDGRGNIRPIPKEAPRLPGIPGRDKPTPRECGRGVRLKIPANSLVDASGRAPAGAVDIQLSTVDLQTPDQMPGNYTVVLADQQTRAMQSYGAGMIEISAGGTKYNLRSGEKATLILPVDRGQVQSGGTLPQTIPLLTYDEARGVWLEAGSATLQTVDGAPAYVGEVTHFTAYNSDLIKTDQACLAVQNQDMPSTYDLEVTIPQTGGAAPVKRLFPSVAGGTSEFAILNLPKDTNIVLVPIRTTDPDPNKNNLPMGVFVVNTGAPQNPSFPTVPGGFANEPVGPPYYHETAGTPDGACSTKVVLRDLGLQFYPATPPTGAFLHGLGSFAAVNLSDTDAAFPEDANQALRDAVAQASVDYRNQIDPRGLRRTLSCFKVANRMPVKPGETCTQMPPEFTPQPAVAETTAVYSNTVDLGFGREMHMVRDGANVAAYVSNYDALVYTGPGSGTDVSKAQTAVQGFNGLIQPDATVAMEFSVIEDDTPDGTPISTSDPTRVVKFYVFDKDGNPADAANLDGLGARPVPQLCMVCHGGQIPNPAGSTFTITGVPTPVFDSRDHVKLNAKFLPFDLRSLSYAAPDSDAANPFNKLNQQTAFRLMNEMVKVAPPPDPTDPSSTLIEDLYTAWYPGNAIPQLENAVVPLWSGNALHVDAYDQLVARSCRTCHITNPEPNLRFEQPGSGASIGFDGNLGIIQLRVCKNHEMPHARRTHDLFWTSIAPSQPARLQLFGDTVDAFGWQKVGPPNVDQLLACGQEFTEGGGPPSPPTAFGPVALVFSGRCTGCHNEENTADGTSFAGLNLEEPGTYSRIVGVNSKELASMKLIEFGTTTETNSYLWRKISNTHVINGASYTPPGPGVAMPQGTAGLTTIDPTQANVIRDWIRNGAQP